MSTNYSRFTFSGDGITTIFPVSFDYLDSADIKMLVDGALLTPLSDYTIDPNLGTVTTATAPANGSSVVVFRNTSLDQKKTTFFDNSVLRAEDLNDALDQVFYVAQEVVDNNALTVAIDPIDNKLDANNFVIKNVANAVDGTDAVNKQFMESYLTPSTKAKIDALDGTALTTVYNNNTNIVTTANNIGNVNIVATDINNVNTVASNISDVNTVATNISSAQDISANLTAVQNASANANTATTKANEASASASQAAQSEGNALVSANAASGSASDANASANAANISKQDAQTAAATATAKAAETTDFKNQLSLGVTTGGAGTQAQATFDAQNVRFNFTIPQGIQGVQGPQGPAGTGLNILGSLDNSGQLPPSASNPGDSYLVGAVGAKDVYFWDGSSWINAGPIEGPQGPVGPAGPEGPQGPQGIQGIQGPQGNTGSAATVAVGAVNTLPAGSNVAVSNSGTSAAAIFDFSIPQGAKGDKGDKGDTGPAGTTTWAGITGTPDFLLATGDTMTGNLVMGSGTTFSTPSITYTIDSNTWSGTWKVATNAYTIRNAADSATGISFDGTSVRLYNGGTERITSTAAGATITGDINITGGDISLGSNWTIVANGTNLDFRYNGTTHFRIQSSGTIQANENITAYAF